MLKLLTDNRHLLRELVSRDVRSRYLGSLAGLFWSVVNPLLQLALYTFVFAVVLRQRFEGFNTPGGFALYLFCALIPWTALQESVVRSAGVWIENASLIKKARFPLELLPAARVLSSLIHQMVATALFSILLLGLGALNWRQLPWLAPLLLLQALMMHGASLLSACLNVFFRDVAQFMGVGLMALFWATPIVYPKERAPEVFVLLLNLNPLTHLVEAYRYVLMGRPVPILWGQAYLAALALLVFAAGRWLLRRTEMELVDLV